MYKAEIAWSWDVGILRAHCCNRGIATLIGRLDNEQGGEGLLPLKQAETRNRAVGANFTRP